MSYLPHFGHNKKLLKSLVRLNHFFNACHQVQYQKNLMNRFIEKFKSVDFGPKNDTCTTFLAKHEFF